MSFREFQDRIVNCLLPEFCSDRSLDSGGFRTNWDGISESDATDFLYGLDHGLLTHKGRGLYRAAQSYAAEQFFWTGRKNVVPRSITLWLEPIITVAALARLHLILGWPSGHLGTQSRKWGFDICAYADPARSSRVVIASEVKKTKSELLTLLSLMKDFGSGDCSANQLRARNEINAYRKVAELRELQAKFFLAVGPDRCCVPFLIEFGKNDSVKFHDVSISELKFESARLG